MKTVQINKADISGGAARAAFRLHKGLLDAGIDDSMVVRLAKLADSRIVEISDSCIEPVRMTEVKPCDLIQRVLIDGHRTEISNTNFTFPYPGLDITAVPQIVDADLINLHWVNYFLSLTTLGKLFSLGKPVVWTLHDQWPFTGGCHYSAGCNGFQEDCLRCPQLFDDRFGLATAVLRDKIELFKGADLTIVTPSRWLGEIAKKSALFKALRVEVIPNAIETDIFTPVAKGVAKKGLGLPEDGIALLFCAERGNEKRKGFREFVEAIRFCADQPAIRKLSAEGRFVLLCIGEPDDSMSTINLPVRFLGYLNFDDEMRQAYSAADLYVLPSLEDNLPNTMLEAMACATPVVAFDVGGVPDMVVPGRTGVLAPFGDTAALGAAIMEMILDKDTRERLGANCRTLVETEYTLNLQATRYGELYAELVRNAAGNKVNRQIRTSVYAVRLDYSFGPFVGMIYKDLVRTAFKQLPVKEKIGRIVDVAGHLYNFALNRVSQLVKSLEKR